MFKKFFSTLCLRKISRVPPTNQTLLVKPHSIDGIDKDTGLESYNDIRSEKNLSFSPSVVTGTLEQIGNVT